MSIATLHLVILCSVFLTDCYVGLPHSNLKMCGLFEKTDTKVTTDRQYGRLAAEEHPSVQVMGAIH